MVLPKLRMPPFPLAAFYCLYAVLVYRSPSTSPSEHHPRPNHEPHVELFFEILSDRSGGCISFLAISKSSGLHGTASSFGGKSIRNSGVSE